MNIPSNHIISTEYNLSSLGLSQEPVSVKHCSWISIFPHCQCPLYQLSRFHSHRELKILGGYSIKISTHWDFKGSAEWDWRELLILWSEFRPKFKGQAWMPFSA